MNQTPHRNLFSHYPLFQIAVAVAAGIFTSNIVQLRLAITITSAATLSMFAVLALIKNRKSIAGVALIIAFIFIGATLGRIEQTTNRPGSVKALAEERGKAEQQVSLTGILNQPPIFASDRVYLLVDVERINISGNAFNASGLVSLLAIFKSAESNQFYRQLDLHYGTRIRATATLNNAKRFRNPGVSSVADFMDAKGLDAVGVIKDPGAIARLGDAPAFKPLAWLYRWREFIQRRLDESFSADTAGVLAASLLGNRYNLSKVTAERFREAGTFHVLVISGVHISFIGGMVFLIARRLTRRRLSQFLWSTVVVWSYGLAVGAEASVIRAACMFTLIALAQVLFRSPSALNSLGAAAIVLLTHSPRELFDPSFQLTFLSVLAIVTLAWPIINTCSSIGTWKPTRATPLPPSCSRLLKAFAETLYWSEARWQAELNQASHSYRLFKNPCALWLERNRLQWLLRYVVNAVIVSISVQLCLLPLFIFYFHRVSWASLLLNIFVSVLLAALCFVALSALVLAAFSVTLSSPLIWLAESFEWLMVHSVDPFSLIGLSAMRVPEYSGCGAAIYFIYYAPLVLLLLKLGRWRPFDQGLRSTSWTLSLTLLAQSALVLVVLFHPLSAGRLTGTLRVDFLDVGQGDAALITMPDGATLLVDGGGRPGFLSTGEQSARDVRSIGEMVVAEYLWWRGLDHVDYILATHADADHIDGLNDIVRNFKVRSALVGRMAQQDAEFSKFVSTLRATGTPLQLVQAGDVVDFGSVKMTVLWPSAAGANRSNNNDSVVLRLDLGSISVLLTGDVEREAEAQILASNSNVAVDVIKVAHHGSKTSSTADFVKAVKPRFAIISVGQQSMFGHPHREVVERWEESGAEVLTTGNCGTITVETDGTTLSVRKFVER
jgi:competence protein ComEC